MDEEETVKAELKAADELVMQHQNSMMPYHQKLSIKSVNVATMMLDTAKNKRDQAMQSLEKIWKKRKLLTDKQYKLSEKAMSSTANVALQKGKPTKGIQSAKRAKRL